MKNWYNYGIIFALLSVGLGAFGAHGLSEILTNNKMVDTFQTAVRYHMFHSLALLFVGINAKNELTKDGLFFVIGIILFSGSLYLLAITNIKWLGAITPLGGVAFGIGWIIMLIKSIKQN
jgi:uncharacterized membrane protein YgdD (TMEM256/DUF423 family)